MVKHIHTHYDNLKVAPDAGAEVIRAAYRALSQKHHPDRNPDDPQAHRTMSIINQSYAVLSDPAQRRAHDGWIAAQQQRLAAGYGHSGSPPTLAACPQQHEAVRPSRPHPYATQNRWQWMAMMALILMVVAAWWLLFERPTAPAPTAETATAPSTPVRAPNGHPFPAHKGYVSGYPVLRQRGSNTVRVDNSDLGSGVFAQLYELRHGKLTAIRSFYIPAGERFTVSKVGDGNFSLHYRRTDNGQWQISAPWLIENTERSGHYRQIEVKL